MVELLLLYLFSLFARNFSAWVLSIELVLDKDSIISSTFLLPAFGLDIAAIISSTLADTAFSLLAESVELPRMLERLTASPSCLWILDVRVPLCTLINSGWMWFPSSSVLAASLENSRVFIVIELWEDTCRFTITSGVGRLLSWGGGGGGGGCCSTALFRTSLISAFSTAHRFLSKYKAAGRFSLQVSTPAFVKPALQAVILLKKVAPHSPCPVSEFTSVQFLLLFLLAELKEASCFLSLDMDLMYASFRFEGFLFCVWSVRSGLPFCVTKAFPSELRKTSSLGASFFTEAKESWLNDLGLFGGGGGGGGSFSVSCCVWRDCVGSNLEITSRIRLFLSTDLIAGILAKFAWLRVLTEAHSVSDLASVGVVEDNRLFFSALSAITLSWESSCFKMDCTILSACS